jgi:hypothetical protein
LAAAPRIARRAQSCYQSAVTTPPKGLRPALWDGLLLLALAAPAVALAAAGVPAPVTVLFNLGPNDADHIQGFEPHYEIAGPVATRWTTYQAEVDLPLALRGGPADLSYRFSRVLPETAVVDVRLNGSTIDRFTCRGGAWVTRTVRLAALPPTPLRIDLVVDSHDRRNLGLKLDWVRLEAAGGRIGFRGRAAWWPVLLVAGAFALFRFGGLSPGMAALAAVPWPVAAWLWGRADPFALAHVLSKLTLPALALTAACAVVMRRRPGGRWVVPLFLAGYLLKGAGVFHPAFFYPDVQNHGRYVQAYAEAQGSIAERGVAAQRKVNTAYPRFVRGRPYAFPYSPVFFIPFTPLAAESAPMEDALRHVGLAAAAAEVAAAFWLGSLALGPGTGVAAAAVAAFLPPLYSRLLYAMWPTIAGHLLDVLAIAAALLLARRPERKAPLVAFGVLTLAAFLTYISSLFNLALFAVFLALLERRRAPALLGVLAAAAGVTVLWLYAAFTRTFVFEIVPALLGGTGVAAPASATGPPPGGLVAALARVPLFYGWGLPALAVAGLVLVRRQGDRAARHVLAAYGMAFVALVLMRGLGGGLFRDLKETTFVGPLVAVTAGASLTALARRGRRGWLAAALVAVGLLAFWAERYLFYFSSYNSVVTRPEPAAAVSAQSAGGAGSPAR